jgi:hypothetical protein
MLVKGSLDFSSMVGHPFLKNVVGGNAMLVKKFDGVRKGGFVREVQGEDETGQIVVELVLCPRAGRQLRQEANHRGKGMSGLMAGGKSADHFSACRGSLKPARRIVHRKDRQYFGRVLREVVLSIINKDDDSVREKLSPWEKAEKNARHRSNRQHRAHRDIADSRGVSIDQYGNVIPRF